MHPIPSKVVPLDQAYRRLRQVLLRLNHFGLSQAQRPTTLRNEMLTHLDDLMELFEAVAQYEPAALASVPALSADVLNLKPAQLRTYRESDPVYQRCWVAGRQVGVAQAEQDCDRILDLYAQHAKFPEPEPFNCSPLIKRVQLLLEFQKDSNPLSVERLNTLRQQLTACSSNTTLYGTH